MLLMDPVTSPQLCLLEDSQWGHCGLASASGWSLCWWQTIPSCGLTPVAPWAWVTQSVPLTIANTALCVESISNALCLPPLLAVLLLKNHFLPCSLSVCSHSLLVFISNDFFFLQNFWLESCSGSSPTSWAICGHAGGKELMGIVICVYKPHPLLYFIWVFQNMTDGGAERVKCYDIIMCCYSK